MARLIWSPQAVGDLKEICEYIARDSDRHARLFARRIIALIEALPDNPLLGAVVPEYSQEDIRERRHQNYRVIYRVLPRAVQIVGITHAARLLPKRPPDENAG